jgi:thiamine biosynthesis lipoprotein
MPFLFAPIMGTTVSIDVRDVGVDKAALELALAVLRDIDARFSTYKADSQISRIDRGELVLSDADSDVREVLAACARLSAESGGAFDAFRDGHLDPSGYVKGWAAERAADVLRAAGAHNFSLNLGGDVICAGEREPGQPWRVGIRHPDNPAQMLAVVAVNDGAVATSGLYERGGHVTDARTGAVADAWRSLTVVAADLVTADSIATAALARGADGPQWAAERLGCSVVALDRDSRLFTSSGIESIRLA